MTYAVDTLSGLHTYAYSFTIGKLVHINGKYIFSLEQMLKCNKEVICHQVYDAKRKVETIPLFCDLNTLH
jgi:hypothetical protein